MTTLLTDWAISTPVAFWSWWPCWSASSRCVGAWRGLRRRASNVISGFLQFGGRPLECWVPAQFTNSWEAYAGEWRRGKEARIVAGTGISFTFSSWINQYKRFRLQKCIAGRKTLIGYRSQTAFPPKYHNARRGWFHIISGWVNATFYHCKSFLVQVPFFLLIEAFMFYVPCMIWRLMNDKSGG